MEIYLIRHTRVAVETSICYGQTDVHSAETFDEEAKHLQARLADVPWDAVYVSPLGRCTRLLPYFSSELIVHDERLKEMHFGNWELQPWRSIEESVFNHWMSNFVHHHTPGGENYWELYERVTAVWNEIVHAGYQGNVAIICHGGVIRALLAHLLSIPLEKSFHLDITYGSVSCIQVNPGFSKVLYINRV